MKSVSGKYWEETKSTQRLIDKIKIENDLNDIQAKLAISRNFSEEELLSIRNDFKLKNPFIHSKDYISACELLKNHISKKNNILIFGDYDVDGCLSVSLLYNFLKKNKAIVNYYIPDRFNDGYGPNELLIDKLISIYKPKLIIFLDCASNSYKTLRYIHLKNISSFVIDHHNIHKPYHLSNIIINPKKNTDYKGIDYLCSAFLTYLFIDLYIKKNQLEISILDDQIYVLLATVADVMPIRGINKILALNVIKKFDINKNFIFNNLFKILKIRKKLELDDLGYIVAPIINSAGRLNNANKIVELFTTKSNDLKLKILENINNLNKKRKLIEKRILDEINFSEIYNQKGVIFIYKPYISEGIIGIIASRIKDYFNRPCIVFTNSNEIIKGSARSTSNFNISEFIQEALNKKIILNGGGHNLAAGVSLLKSNINTFKKFIDKHYHQNNILNKNFYISKILPHSINKNFFEDLKILGPFGHKNPNPIFLIEQLKIIKPKLIKEKFISCFLKKNNKLIKAISFNHLNTKISYEILNSKNYFDIFIKIKENKWNNKTSIELEIIDLIKNTNKT